MARPYSEKFLEGLYKDKSDNLGVLLGRACVEANIPATYVAVALETTRITVYEWFRGQEIRRNSRRRVEAFMELLEEDTRNKRLPARDHRAAKKYIEEMLGVSF